MNWFKQRNNWHYLVPIIVEPLLYLATFQAYQMIGRFLISVIILSFGCVLWEMFWEDRKGYTFDWEDVRKGVVSTVVVGIICVIVHYFIVGHWI